MSTQMVPGESIPGPSSDSSMSSQLSASSTSRATSWSFGTLFSSPGVRTSTVRFADLAPIQPFVGAWG